MIIVAVYQHFVTVFLLRVIRWIIGFIIIVLQTQCLVVSLLFNNPLQNKNKFTLQLIPLVSNPRMKLKGSAQG